MPSFIRRLTSVPDLRRSRSRSTLTPTSPPTAVDDSHATPALPTLWQRYAKSSNGVSPHLVGLTRPATPPLSPSGSSRSSYNPPSRDVETGLPRTSSHLTGGAGARPGDRGGSAAQSPGDSQIRTALDDVITYHPQQASGGAPAADMDAPDDIPDYYTADFSPLHPPPGDDRLEGRGAGQTEGTPAAKGKKQSKSAAKKEKKSRAGAPLDFIDTLDTIGGFHHDGPFDAASSHRNRSGSSRNPSRQAPMLAFDPASLDPTAQLRAQPGTGDPYSAAAFPVTRKPSGRQNGSENLEVPGSGALRHPQSSAPGLVRRLSEQSLQAVSMGYPAGKIAQDPKAAKLAEAFGIQDREAWEDYGRVRYEPDQSRDSVHYPPSSTGAGASTPERREKGERPAGGRTGKSERSSKAASVWDMEATLKEGRPVASAPPVPPMPPVPTLTLNRISPLGQTPSPSAAPQDTAWNGSSGEGRHEPRRTKSLISRLRKSSRHPNAPAEGDPPAQPSRAREELYSEPVEQPPSPRPGLAGRSHHSSKSLGALALATGTGARTGAAEAEAAADGVPTGDSPTSPRSATTAPKSPGYTQEAYFGASPGRGGGGYDEAGANQPGSGSRVVRKPSLLQKFGLGRKR